MELLSSIFNFFSSSKAEPEVPKPAVKVKQYKTTKEISHKKRISTTTESQSTGYCLRCKAQRHMLNPEVVRVAVALNRYHDQLKGSCIECSRTIVAFTKQ